MYNIIIYEDKNGKSEIKDYITNLQKRNDKDSIIKFGKIMSYIELLKESGLKIGEPYIKHIECDIWELRPRRDRIFLAYWENDSFILLSIFMKKTQKTPRREIEKAKRLLKDYKERRDNYGL